MRNVLILLIILLTLPRFAVSAPSTPSASDTTMAHGQAITITGTSFGTKSPAKPQVWAPFDSDINPSSLGMITSWYAPESVNMQTWVSNCGPDGSGCAQGSPYDGEDYNTAWWGLGVDTSSQGWDYNDFSQKSYVFKKIRHTFAFVGNTKVFRNIGDTAANDVLQTYSNDGWGPEYCGDGYTNSVYFNPPSSWYASTVWNTSEYFVQANSNTSTYNGYYRWDINGSNAMVCDSRSGGTCQPNDKQVYIAGSGCGNMNIYNVLYLSTHNTYPAAGSRVYGDDLYLDNTWARVMICSGSTWAARGTCEIQIPTAWSSTEVSIVANQGEIPDDTTRYLYVVDSAGDGSVNGQAITFSDAEPPAVTAVLTGGTLRGGTITH